MNAQIRNRFALVVLALTLTPAHAGIFTQVPDDVCERALGTKAMKGVIAQISSDLDARGLGSARNDILSRVTGRGETRPNRAVYHEADDMAVYISAYLNAFEAL